MNTSSRGSSWVLQPARARGSPARSLPGQSARLSRSGFGKGAGAVAMVRERANNRVKLPKPAPWYHRGAAFAAYAERSTDHRSGIR